MNDSTPDPDDVPRGPTGRKISPAVFASNWRTILAVDALAGVIVALIGVALLVWVSPWLGWPAIIVGAVYVAFVGRRALQWRFLRHQAGL